MLICPSCQFANPVGHKFCQHCGEPLIAGDAKVDGPNEVGPDLVAANPAEPPNRQRLQAILMPPEQLALSPATYIEGSSRYEVSTLLSQGIALVNDTQPEVRSPLQQQLPALSNQPLTTLQATPGLPAAAYPYLLLNDAAPRLHDAWQQAEATVLITATEPADVSTLIQSFSTAIDPLQHVYWLYILTDLWAAIAPLPQWRNSLLLANNLCITRDQSVRIRQFIPPRTQPSSAQADSTGPAFSELKAFLQSLLAQPHRGNIAPLRQMRKIILTVTSAQNLEQLQTELATIGQYLLATPEAITPPPTSSAAATDTPRYRTLTAESLQSSVSNLTVSNPMEETTPLENSISLNSEETEAGALEDDILIEKIDPTDSDESTMVLPMKLISIESAGRTDVGRQRDHNEDCFFISSSTVKRADNQGQTTEAHSLYVLCDGMGGHAGGEVASQLAAETLSAYFTKHWPHPLPGEAPSPLPNKETLVEAVGLANQAIFDINEKESRAGHERMGTTLVVVLLQGTEAVVAHVGDSRLYQHTRRIGLRQITTDHEVGQREMQRGIPQEIAYARPDAYQLTQALGPRGNADLAPSVSYLSFSEDTLLLLCSDGLSDNNLVEDYLSTHLDPILKGKKEIEMGIDELIKLGNEVNGHDNISAIAIRVKVSPDLEKMQEKRHPEQGQTVLQ